MNTISGRWHFKEDFGFGTDEGFAELKQHGEIVTGVVVYTEKIDEETPFRVEQFVKGTFKDRKLIITGTKVNLFDVEKQFEYNLDTWEGELNKNNQIVGHSYDNHDCFGVFVMEKIKL